MGDAVCGPSNPLQAFRKQTQADRSLQQDRLTSARNPAAAQGFRSSPGPKAGILDAEFEAFQNGSPMGLPPQELHHGPMHAGPAAFQQQHMPGPAAGGWAADFQRLHISQPAPRVQPQQPSMSNWHQEFAQQARALTPQPAQASYLPQMHQSHPYAMNYMQQSNFSPQPVVSYGQTQSMKGKETFDDAAFEAEFQRHADEALAQAEEAQISAQHLSAQEEEAAVQIKAQAEAHDTSFANTQRHSARSHFDAEMNPLREWAEAIRQNEVEETVRLEEEEVRQEMQPPPVIDEDLARTAGELLERVAGDSSDKFRNSEFLRLMRRVRDGEATIRDGQMQDSESASADQSSTDQYSTARADQSSVAPASQTVPTDFLDGQDDSDQFRHKAASGLHDNQPDPPRFDLDQQYGRHPVADFS